MLISQPGSDYQLTTITLDTGRARDITCLLLDIHAVLDQLHLDGTRPQITSTADATLRESGSPYTLPGLINALDEVISQRHAHITQLCENCARLRQLHWKEANA